MMVDLDELRELVGTELAEGTYTVAGYESWLTNDVLGSPPLPPGLLHPMHVFYAGLCGVGFSIAEVFEMVRITPEDGPMIGEMDLRQRRPLRVGETLTVRTRITDLVRKSGRSGVFDLMTMNHSVVDARGDEVGTLVNTHVYPRRST